MQLNKMNQNSADEFSNISINEKLHEWEKLENCSSPLSTFQRNTCLDLGDEVITRFFPKSLVDEENETKREGSTDEPVLESTYQFVEWYTAVSNDWLNSGNEKYEPLLRELKEKRTQCSDILDKVEESIKQIEQLKLEYDQVTNKTNPLFSISEKLSAEQAKLGATLNDINDKLSPFQTIESVYKRLESGAISVTGSDFLQILDDIDECYGYFEKHESYKEYNTYLLKTKHCLSRALSDVKSYVVNVLETCKNVNSAASLMTTTLDGVSVDVAKSSKFVAQYGRFQAVAPKLKPLLSELESRVDKSYEYECALEECQKNYVALRQQIMGPSLRELFSKLVTSRMGDYCALLRSSATHLIYVSQDEDKLYYQFFSKSSTSFSDFIESMCSILYDTMRPLVIHMKHMETLAEFCSILRVEILQDHVQNNSCLYPFGNIAEQLLRDVQERLVFRAHLYFKTDILQFNPSPGDLAYPEKLEMMKDIAEEIRAQETFSLSRCESRVSLSSVSSCGDSVRSSRVSKPSNHSSPADLHGMWYPTIRRTLVCLSRLYRCVEGTVFQGLAQEAISCCTDNVNQASEMISKNKSVIDGQLFLIKHLLILREQIAPFNVDFTVTEMSLDFTNLKSAAYGLLQRNKLFALNSNNAILEFILHGSPLVKENYLDSRKIVDKQLKNTCEAFILYTTNFVVSPLTTFIQQVEEYKALNSRESLKEKVFGKPEHVQNTVTECVKKVKSFIGTLQNKMELYLANPDTQSILYKPIKNNICNTFSKAQTVISENYETDDQLLIACPTPEQISVLLSSVTLPSRKISIASTTCTVKETENGDQHSNS